MTLVVIGLGSMGKRRIRLIQLLDQSISVLGIDTNSQRRNDTKKKFNIDTFESIDEAMLEHEISCAFVCTSPLSHNEIISQCLLMGLHVFSEINLVNDGYEENIYRAAQHNCKLFLSSTFLYRDETNFIIDKARNTKEPINYIYHIGQYLPDWHPWEDYSGFFAGDKRTNGCREIFAIELPWLIKAFGNVVKQTTASSRNTKLKIDYDDNYMVILEHENGNKGVLVIDVVSRNAVRDFTVYSEQFFLKWDGSPSGLKEYDITLKREMDINLYNSVDHLDGYSSFVVENAYMNEIKAFFQFIEDDVLPIYGFEDDLKTIKLIDEIERNEK